MVPSPNVAEDHQTKNAMALVKEEAAIMIADWQARNTLVEEALKLVQDNDRCVALSARISRLGKPKAAEEIVQEIEKLLV